MNLPVTPGTMAESGREAPGSVTRHVLPDYHKAFAVIAHPVTTRCENCS